MNQKNAPCQLGALLLDVKLNGKYMCLELCANGTVLSDDIRQLIIIIIAALLYDIYVFMYLRVWV